MGAVVPADQGLHLVGYSALAGIKQRGKVSSGCLYLPLPGCVFHPASRSPCVLLFCDIFSLSLPSTQLLHASPLTQWHQTPNLWNWTKLILQLSFTVWERRARPKHSNVQGCQQWQESRRGWALWIGKVPMGETPVLSSKSALSPAAAL